VGFADRDVDEKGEAVDGPLHDLPPVVVDDADTPASPVTPSSPAAAHHDALGDAHSTGPSGMVADVEAARPMSLSPLRSEPGTTNLSALYTHNLRGRPPLSYRHTLRPWNGRLRQDKWYRVAFRPVILFAYPAVLWSALVYSLSIGWLIVLSESIAHIYQGSAAYNFSPLATGLVYVSPFVGGILGTAVAGKVSDIIVRYMTRRNGGVYEPEFRLVMAIPVALSTAAGLMGFGWSAQEHDAWIVPTIFFGLISFGCSLGSTTSITFCVDSYRQYAGEALVTLNFSKSTLDPFSVSQHAVGPASNPGLLFRQISSMGWSFLCSSSTGWTPTVRGRCSSPSAASSWPVC
jgi:hypothetical protein